ncbi:MAG: DegT/DnrJ/EryC1/StrS family aminotransferase, partial [Candidatus Omnitrophica bacterium]|nr:DegT/DnrJ/EryC1/StrS family aminotransferase [Candidatus Omnitrophota bacterium]
PLCVPNIDKKELKSAEKVIKSGWLTDGPKNAEFEKTFAAYIGTKRAVSLNSCTSALQLALEALSIKGEVILPSFTFVASANAIVKAGARPVFADIDYKTCNIDPHDVERKITKRTQAIMVVHYGGQACEMDRIIAIAKRRNLSVIEDSAETLGGTYRGRKTGSFGIGCFSFFPTKNITTGEGGMLVTESDEIADRVKALAAHGISRSTYEREKAKNPWYREAFTAGYNYRMSSILAAIGIEQLKKLDGMNRKRRANAAYLNRRLVFPELEMPFEGANSFHVYQMYTVRTKGINRDEFISGLREKGVMASVHFTPPVHMQRYYARTYNYGKGDLPVTEDVSDRIVTLPMYPGLTRKELDYIVRSVEHVVNNMRRGRKKCR